MIIYLDESKRIWKGEIVIGGFLSFHNTHYIDTFVKNKKKEFGIPEKIELKSTNKFWKLFLDKISFDKDFEKLKISTFGYHFENYFFDSSETYMNFLIKIFIKIFEEIDFWGNKIIIVQDNINISDNRVFENKINWFIKKKFWFKSEFKIRNSKNILSLQFADLIVWEYKKLYFFDDVNFLEEYILTKNL